MSEPFMPTPVDSGDRDVIDEREAEQLGADNPNVAASPGDNIHETHIGDEAEDADSDEVAKAAAELDKQAS